MTLEPYLLHLTQRLRRSLRRPEADRDLAAAFLLGRRDASGGFRGRLGEADLYYTAFAVRALAVLDRLAPDVAAGAAAFAAAQPVLGTIDAAGTLYVRRLCAGAVDARAGEAILSAVEACRCDDGGYARRAGGGASSTYHSFLAAMAYDLLGRTPPAVGALGAFIRGRRREDGGFAELAAMPRGSTNPTAAAVVLALLAGVADEELLAGTVRFLVGLRRPDGSWPASAASPAGDLMSTLTALLTLSDLGQAGTLDGPASARFVRACARGGGFAATAADPEPDAEYTFYGLACEALL